jgi:hypothetical protein
VCLFIFSVSITYSMPIQHMNSWDMWEVVLPLECVILYCCTLLSFYTDPPFSLNHCRLRNFGYIMVVSRKLGRNAPWMVFVQFGNSIWHYSQLLLIKFQFLMTRPLCNPMKRNPMKPQLQDSLKPLLENKLKSRF